MTRRPAAAAAIWTLASAFLLLVPLPAGPPLPAGLAALPLDKLAHVALFAALGRAWRRAAPGISFGVRLLALTGWGGLLELAQGALGTRAAERGDLAADLAGAALGSLL